MKKQILIAGMMLAGATAKAESVNVPDICKGVANYAAQALDLDFSDGSFSDPSNPSKVRLVKDFKKFPITKMTFLGNCDEDSSKLKESWCQVAGGSPDVFQIDISKVESKDNVYPEATVIVTYNRGGCWVDEAAKP